MKYHTACGSILKVWNNNTAEYLKFLHELVGTKSTYWWERKGRNYKELLGTGTRCSLVGCKACRRYINIHQRMGRKGVSQATVSQLRVHAANWTDVWAYVFICSETQSFPKSSLLVCRNHSHLPLSSKLQMVVLSVQEFILNVSFLMCLLMQLLWPKMFICMHAHRLHVSGFQIIPNLVRCMSASNWCNDILLVS